MIYVLLKNTHSLIHCGEGKQPNCLQLYGFQERHAFQSRIKVCVARLSTGYITILLELRCTIAHIHIRLLVGQPLLYFTFVPNRLPSISDYWLHYTFED